MFSKVFRITVFSVIYFLIAINFVLELQAHEAHNSTKVEIEKHRQEDFGFEGFKELNKQLQKDYESFDYKQNLSLRMPNQTLLAPNSHIVGEWSPIYQSPIVLIHTMLMPNGKVLAWDSVGDNPTESYSTHNFTRAVVYDPTTFEMTRVDNQTGYNLFCAGMASLPNGRPFLAGGNKDSALNGINRIHTFNYSNNSWLLSPSIMAGERWYPSVTPLANGEMLVTSGRPTTHEVYTASGDLRVLTNAVLELPLYPWLEAAPNGKALYFGPSDNLRWLNTGGVGSWENIGGRDGLNRDYGSFAMYDIGKVLVTGGGTNGSLKSTKVLNFSNTSANPTVENSGDLITGRRQHNLVPLADGSVLAIGGLSSNQGLVDLNAGVFTAELWNPTTKTWTQLSSMQKIRQYHSIAMLLPDGRVMVGGGGICGTCYNVGYLEKNYEIFSPPYLFKKDGSGELAQRPQIFSAPSSVNYNENFTVSVDNATDISQVVMMRVPSVTHSVNFEQRRVPLTFSNSNGTIQATSPNNSNIAPPGFYMLTVINSQGVPSVAKMVQINNFASSSSAFTYISDMNWSSATNGWGNAEKNRSNGETGSLDGTTISLNGVNYYKGLGVHANSDISIPLNSQYSRFQSDIGVDEEVGNNGSVIFQVYLDGTKVYDSGTMIGTSATKTVDLDTTNKQTLRLVVTDAGNGNGYDHADWANARLTRATVTPITNLALGKTTSQISTAYNGIASRAVDGNTNGNWSNNSVTHTNNNYQSWWQVDLGSVKNISQIKLWNRTDCCSTRLSNFRVFVSDVPFTSTNLTSTVNQSGVSNYRFAGSFTGSTLFNIARTGRYVRVQLEGTNFLSLAEVEVLGN